MRSSPMTRRASPCSKADPTLIPVVAYTDIIEVTEGWLDGVYIINDGELEEAEEI